MHHVTNPTKPDTMARTESNSHTYTSCAVNNMTLLSYIFSSDLKAMENILVATSVTAYNDPLLGTTVMFVFNQALWFGSSMGQSLIANNQFLSRVIQLSENPYDKNSPLGIVDHDSYWYLPFTLQQSSVGVETRSTKIKEYNDCTNILYMTSDNRWDPSYIQIPHHSLVIGAIECSHSENILTTPNMMY